MNFALLWNWSETKLNWLELSNDTIVNKTDFWSTFYQEMVKVFLLQFNLSIWVNSMLHMVYSFEMYQ